MRRSLLILTLAGLLAAPAVYTQTAPPGPKLIVAREIDNPQVTVLRLTMPPGYQDPVTSGKNDLVVVQASAGEVEVLLGSEKTTARQEPGKVWFVPKGMPHAFSNPGKTPFQLIVTVLK